VRSEEKSVVRRSGKPYLTNSEPPRPRAWSLLAHGPLVQRIASRPWLAAVLQAILLYWLILPQGALFSTMGPIPGAPRSEGFGLQLCPTPVSGTMGGRLGVIVRRAVG
jgi:hypothetical protein